MILIIGGVASGKQTFVQSLGFSMSDIADATLDERPVLLNLQELVTCDTGNPELLLPALLEKAVVVCNEIGSGVIPTDPKARIVREEVGKLCILLAQHAEKVIRMICGIPQTLYDITTLND